MPYTLNGPELKSISGARKPTVGALLARQRDLNYKGFPKDITRRYKILFYFDRYAPIIKLSNSAKLLFTDAFRMTQAQDWKPNSRPICWKSKIEFAFDLDMSVKTVSRAQRELHSHGLIDFKDQPSRKRTGRRDSKDNIILSETFGINLSPMASMIDVMKRAIAANIVIKKRHKAVRKARSTLKAEYENIQPHIEAYLPIETQNKIDHNIMYYRDLSKKTKVSLETRERAMKAMRRTIDKARKSVTHIHCFLQALHGFKPIFLSKSHPEGGKDVTPIHTITNTILESVKGLSGGVVTAEGKPKRKLNRIQQRAADIRAKAEANPTPQPKKRKKPSFEQVKLSLPFHIRDTIKDDYGFYEMLDVLKIHAPRYGLDEKLVTYGRNILGLERVCAVISVIIEKYPTLNNSSRYFRALVAKHSINELYINKSLFGIVDRRGKGKAHDDKARSTGQLDLIADF